LGIHTGHFSEHRHSILRFTTINNQKIKKIETSGDNYDDDNDSRDNGDDGCRATTAMKNNNESGSSGIYRGAPRFVDPFVDTKNGSFQGQYPYKPFQRAYTSVRW
jgi:hypothetical protein